MGCAKMQNTSFNYLWSCIEKRSKTKTQELPFVAWLLHFCAETPEFWIRGWTREHTEVADLRSASVTAPGPWRAGLSPAQPVTLSKVFTFLKPQLLLQQNGVLT